MKLHRVLAIVTSTLLVGGLLTVPASIASADDPRPQTQSCEKEGLSLAEVTQKTERFDHIVPKPDGRFVPVIMVHGLNSSSDVFTGNIDLTANPGQSVNVGRNLITQIQSISGTAVYLFDYRKDANKWVVDGNIAPALGRAIDCLYQATGEKVIVVAHSMGGLATRMALRNPSSRADKVSTLITFGTPTLGSVLASMVTEPIKGVSLPPGSSDFNMLKSILDECGLKKSINSSASCGAIPEELASLYSDAGTSMTYKNPDLERLKPVSSSVNVVALAGEAIIRSGSDQVMVFGRIINTGPDWGPEYRVGDIVVTSDSALADSRRQRTITCRYQTDPRSMAIGAVVPTLVSLGKAAMDGPCFHGNLMRSIELTNEAIGTIDDELVSRGGGSAQDTVAPPAGSLFQSSKIQCQNGSRLVLVAKTENGEAGQCLSNDAVSEFGGYLAAYSTEYMNGEQQMVLYRGDLPLVDGALNAISEGYDLTVGPKRVTYVDPYGDKVIDDAILQIASEDGVEIISDSAQASTSTPPSFACELLRPDRVEEKLESDIAEYIPAESDNSKCTIDAGSWKVVLQFVGGVTSPSNSYMTDIRQQVNSSAGGPVQLIDAPSLSDGAFVYVGSPPSITARWVHQDTDMTLTAYRADDEPTRMLMFTDSVRSLAEDVNGALGG